MRLIAYQFLGFFCMFMIISCDQNPLGLNYRKVTGNYYLHRWEDGKTYYLEENGIENINGGGVFNGIVTKIGWNNDYIIAQVSPTFKGDNSGWLVLDVRKKTIKGAYSDEIVETIPESKGIRYIETVNAWNELQ